MAEEAQKQCVLKERLCTKCGECNFCDENPAKICDNCMECIGLGEDKKFNKVFIDEVKLDKR